MSECYEYGWYEVWDGMGMICVSATDDRRKGCRDRHARTNHVSQRVSERPSEPFGPEVARIR